MSRTRHTMARQRVALLAVASMLVSPVAPLLEAQAPAPAPATAPAQPKAPATPAAPKAPTTTTEPAVSLTKVSTTPKAAAPAPAQVTDLGWPRAYTTATGGHVLLYQPQVADWAGQKHITAYGAVSWQPKGAAKPTLGSVKIESNTKVSIADRLVKFSTLKITEANFPQVPKEQVREVVDEIEKAIPDEERIIALDRVMAMVDTSKIIPKDVAGVKADPPAIFFSQSAAVLVNIDGEPIWSPIQGNDLKFAVNTNWDLFEHTPTKTFYLRNDASWLKAAAIAGPWTPAGKLPESFGKLPADENWKEVKAALPGKAYAGNKAPTVFVSEKPAEMILLTGAPAYKPVPNSKLVWVSNTESDVFRLGEAGTIYYLVAGRWFSATDFKGPWTFATPSLPPDFHAIALEHPRSRVLASVPGTQQAAEAVLLAQVPQTARVNKKELKAPEVTYQGEPKFDPIPSTTVARAVNTDKDIIKVGDLYYLCFQGVWFVSKAPTGPWQVTSDIPKTIYEIPASSPSHNVTYVTVEEDDDDWVTFAAVAGYTGVMVAWGCAVWGSGYYYPPYYGYGGMYPYYYPHYPTYGYGAYYNPWTGAYGRTAVAYGPYGGAGVSSRYNPRTGTYSRGAAAWGPYGARGYGEAYNPRTGAYGQTRQGSNVYGSWGSTAVTRGDDWARTSRVTNNRGTTTRVTQGSGGGEAISRRGGVGGNTTVGRTGGGDVYAGHDGNVYRKSGDNWQKYDNGGWGDVNRPQPTTEQRDAARQRATEANARGGAGSSAGTVDQLNRDARARTQGTQRTGDYGNYRGTGSTRSGGSTYRPSGGNRSYGGGGMRGGGGRRR
jgi:hypothetical protein